MNNMEEYNKKYNNLVFYKEDIDYILNKVKKNSKAGLQELFTNRDYASIYQMLRGFMFAAEKAKRNIEYENYKDAYDKYMEVIKKYDATREAERIDIITRRLPEIKEKLKALNIKIEKWDKKIERELWKKYHSDENAKDDSASRVISELKEILEKYPEFINELKQENVKEEQVEQKNNTNNSKEAEESTKNNSMQSISTKEGILSPQEIVEIVRDITNKKYSQEQSEELTKKVYNSLIKMINEKNISRKNLGQFINQEFGERIEKNVIKHQRGAIRDNIFSKAQVILNSKDKSKNEGMQSTNNIKNVELLSPEKRPRERLINESIEEYEKFLEEFYNQLFPNQQNESNIQSATPLGISQKPDPLGIPKKKDPLGIPKNPDPLGLPKPKDEIIDVYSTPPLTPPEEEPQKFETAATIINSITKEIYDENGELEDIVGAQKQDIRHLKYANLKVFDTFKNSFKNGNYIYNLNPANIAKAVISIPANLVMKIYGNIGYGKKTRKRIEILKQRAEALTDEQVEIILKEHTAGQKQDMNFTNVVEELVNRRIQRYQLDKLEEVNIFVDKTVAELIDKKSFIEEIDKSLESDSLTEEQRNKLMEQRAKLLEGCKEQVAMIFEKKEEASKLISHGFSEDTRAKFTKMGYAGKRFSFGQREIKTIEDQQFNQKLADLDLKARHPQTDEEALNAFIENEMFYAENSEIKNSIFGRRDTGKVKNNNRFIVKEQDYRNDPLIGDLIRSAALITSAVSVVTGIKAVKDAEQMRATHNQDVNNINAQNQTAINDIHKEAQNISSQSQAMIDGAETISMSNSSELGEFFHNIAERVERSKGNSYGQIDQQAHQLYNQYMSNTQNTISQITQNITSGSLSRSQALQQYGALNDQLVSDLSSMCQQYGSFMQKYAQNSPNFDYSGTLETINYFSNSHNIKGMFDAMSQSLSSAEAISNLNIQLAPLLDKLPNNIKEQIAAATATTALAYYTSQKINKTYEEGKYGKAQDKLEEYIAKKKAQEEEYIEDYIDEEEIEKDGGRSR